MTREERFAAMAEYHISFRTDRVPEEYLQYATFLPADCDAPTLRGSFDGRDFHAPEWAAGLDANSDAPMNLLVIRGMETLSDRAQTKFRDILKFRKSWMTELPENCAVVVLLPADFRLNPEIGALMARVY